MWANYVVYLIVNELPALHDGKDCPCTDAWPGAIAGDGRWDVDIQSTYCHSRGCWESETKACLGGGWGCGERGGIMFNVHGLDQANLSTTPEPQ